MSFATTLNTIMTSDTSLNAYCDGGIRYENLPTNFEIVKNWIVYSFNKDKADIGCLSGSLYSKYLLAVKIVATDTLVLETIGDRLTEYLEGTASTDAIDFSFVSDNHTLDLDKKIYMNTLQFDVLYV
jgi:hypothetical protein